ncbi:hypothetical protein BpHYR1_054218 [Brachionus plicatilis]|uniref:Transmembrane protein n=1 Tax=Brachionus plicatilis TaxID=10195 RepID=A0A3M7PXZ6_BRAPC|nr:hypothetical protein BpHYR1_054218 [Brachionus plicatilis]
MKFRVSKDRKICIFKKELLLLALLPEKQLLGNLLNFGLISFAFFVNLVNNPLSFFPSGSFCQMLPFVVFELVFGFNLVLDLFQSCGKIGSFKYHLFISFSTDTQKKNIYLLNYSVRNDYSHESSCQITIVNLNTRKATTEFESGFKKPTLGCYSMCQINQKFNCEN